jgi:hypothetical protein
MFTEKPPVPAAPFRETVQLSVPVPVSVALAQVSALRTGTPEPPRLMTVDGPVEELLAIVNIPAAVPVDVGSNCTVSVADCPGLNVSGKLAPVAVNPLPLTVAELTVT